MRRCAIESLERRSRSQILHTGPWWTIGRLTCAASPETPSRISSFPYRLRLWGDHFARALPKRRLQVCWTAVLFQQVRKRFLCEFLKVLHRIARQQVNGAPGGIVELHALARHICHPLLSILFPGQSPDLACS